MVVAPQSLTRLRVERVVAGGDGLAREADGRVVFVPGGLPDEEVEVRLVSAKRDFARGELVQVLDPSPWRVRAPCPARARGCGGCDWQHVSAEGQMVMKADVVREALRRTGRMPDAHVEIGGSVPSWAYRTSMRFSLDSEGRPSLRRARTNDDIVIGDCPVAHPALSELLPTLQIEGGGEVSLRVSASTGERTAWWDPPELAAVGLDPQVATGADAHLVEHVHGVPFRVSASSFFQSGPQAAALLVDTVRAVGGDALASARRVLDAYGGVGLFACTVAGADADVVLVEGSASACADAVVNLGDRRATVMHSPMLDWTPEHVDVIVADPSRQGLGAEAVARLAATEADVVLLVSCDPVAMARDAALLAEVGYAHSTTVVLDLFPQTHHVEGVSRFVRRRQNF